MLGVGAIFVLMENGSTAPLSLTMPAHQPASAGNVVPSLQDGEYILCLS